MLARSSALEASDRSIAVSILIEYLHRKWLQSDSSASFVLDLACKVCSLQTWFTPDVLELIGYDVDVIVEMKRFQSRSDRGGNRSK